MKQMIKFCFMALLAIGFSATTMAQGANGNGNGNGNLIVEGENGGVTEGEFMDLHPGATFMEFTATVAYGESSNEVVAIAGDGTVIAIKNGTGMVNSGKLAIGDTGTVSCLQSASNPPKHRDIFTIRIRF